jgi:hypothetical protein
VTFIPPSSSPSGSGLSTDFSVNAASADILADLSVVLRTGSRTNAAGAYVGGGTGNKSILGVPGFSGLPLGNLQSLSFEWKNVIGPAGPNYIPPEAVTTVTPYCNLIVDFDPNGAGDIRVLVILTDQVPPAVRASLGTYTNLGNVLTYSWDADTQNASIVNAPPNPVPGGVLPDVNVGPLWLERSYKFTDLVAANPDAILVDAYPNDGGLPAGAVVPAILILSGDSGTLVKSGKWVSNIMVNGLPAIS